MKPALCVLAVVGLAGLGWLLATRPAPPPERSAASPTATLSDPVAVFQRAFWKRPAADDTILHAERREWSGADGVQKWQWFIAVEPSAALLKYLRDDNAFSLVPATSAPAITDAPAWFAFPPGDVDILLAPHGNLRLFFSKTKRRLYATDAGAGFLSATPESTKH